MAGPQAQSMSDIRGAEEKYPHLDRPMGERPTVETAMLACSSAIDTAHSLLTKLEDKISPVQRTDIDGVGSDKRAMDATPGQSTVQDHLWSLNERIQSLSDRISVNIERVDL